MDANIENAWRTRLTENEQQVLEAGFNAEFHERFESALGFPILPNMWPAVYSAMAMAIVVSRCNHNMDVLVAREKGIVK